MSSDIATDTVLVTKDHEYLTEMCDKVRRILVRHNVEELAEVLGLVAYDGMDSKTNYASPGKRGQRIRRPPLDEPTDLGVPRTEPRMSHNVRVRGRRV